MSMKLFKFNDHIIRKMNRGSGIVFFFLFCTLKTLGQCPTLVLSSTSGSTCGIVAVTVSGNTFGGGATKVTITENGGGSVSPTSATVSPFSFTYTPKSADAGKKITITVTTNNPKGSSCTAATSTYTLSVNAIPATPVAGTITKPTCTVATGSVALSGLPSTGSWTITRKPGDVTTAGTGTTTTISGIAAGTYTFAVTNSAGCTSASSANVVIPVQPASPAVPVQTVDCSAGVGKAVVKVTSPVGTGLTYSIDGGNYQSSVSFSSITDGSHLISVKNTAGCITTGSTFQVSCGCIAPPAVIIGLITQPTCNLSTGSVVLTGLPASGNWTLTRSPGNISTTGSGASITITDLPTGTYTYTVTNSGKCTSPPSADIVIARQPAIPAAPIIGTITTPTCTLPTGSVEISGLPQSGQWTLTRYPGAIITTGSGVVVTLSGIQPGLYNFTVTNENGCVSGLSANALISGPTGAPSPPEIGTIIQPGGNVLTWSVVLNGLPAEGSWSLKRSPDNVTLQGTGNSATITGLTTGSYYFSVTNSNQCTSGLSAVVTIGSAPDKPVVVITFPAPVCYPETIDLTDPKITAGSSPNLIYTYWSDASATIPYSTPKASSSGTWYIKGTLPNGAFDIEPVMVTVYHNPVANAGPDQVLTAQNTAQLNGGAINNYETGLWTVISGTGNFFNPTIPNTTVSGLSENNNIFVWKVTNGVCAASLDTIVVTLHSHLIPTLITPNMDGRNDYLVIKGFENADRIELVIFDRRGTEVFKSENYDNKWNGVDMKGNPLESDTYFYVIKTDNKYSLSGYFLIKR